MGWWADERTMQLRVIGRMDLSEAYAAVRRRNDALRRRRLISSIVAGVVLAGVFSVVGVYYVASIPLPDALELPATTTVYYADATTVMARLGSQNRVTVDVAALPAYVSAAVVAAEDPGFWGDSGSKIARQYARVATGLAGSGVTERARVLVTAWKMEDQYSKEQILGFHLNSVYFGRGAYGIEAAAKAYFDVTAARLSLEQAVLLAGVLTSPGDGRYDPTINLGLATERFATVASSMVSLGTMDEATARSLLLPRVKPYDATAFESGLDAPTGLVVAQVLAELRGTGVFDTRPAGFIENGGLKIVTTIDPGAQRLLERTVDETVEGSLMADQPGNLQAAAVVVQPGTGRVLAYYGGHDGTGADYAGWYLDPSGGTAGYGAHPPAQTFAVYTLAAALRSGISVQTRWDSPPAKVFPASGHDESNPVREVTSVACQPSCSLVEATTASRNIPFYTITERLGAAKVIDAARSAGIESMWVPGSAQAAPRRVDLRDSTGANVSPRPFGTDVALGPYPVSVVDQANAMATFAAGGLRASAHFVDRVSHGPAVIYSAAVSARPALDPAQVADLTWVLSQNVAGHLEDGRASATKVGTSQLRDSSVETAHAWIVGYTANLAMAVWVGNEEAELPLKTREGARVTGAGLPAQMYRAFMGVAHQQLRLAPREFPAPAFTGDPGVGDAAAPGA